MKWIIALTLTFVATGAFAETMASDGDSRTPKTQTTPNTQTTPITPPGVRPDHVLKNAKRDNPLAKVLRERCKTDYPGFREVMKKEISADITSLEKLQIKADENHDAGWVSAIGQTLFPAENLRNQLKEPLASVEAQRCTEIMDQHEEIHRILREAPKY